MPGENSFAKKCQSCLSSVPCPAFLSWILLMMGLGGFAGGIVYGLEKSRKLIKDDTFLHFGEYIVIGLCVGMFLFGTFFLILCHLSSEPSSRRFFNSSAKNMCARGLNMAVLIINYCLIVIWVIFLSLISVPMALLTLTVYIHDKKDGCLHLNPYGISDRKFCSTDVDIFKITGKEAFISYCVAYGATLCVIISLVSYLVCLTANFTHLRDSRFATLNAYNEDVRLSKHSVLETNM